MKTSSAAKQKLEQLKRDGFCVIEDVANKSLLEKTCACATQAVASLDDDQLARARSPGSLINSDVQPALADLIGNPRALRALNEIGLHDIMFWKAVIISKPPGGPRLYWHQDCMMWHDPRAYSDVPPMIFLMYYLEDTARDNGCIRVLPGTHRMRHVLHSMGAAHTYDINSVENPDDPRFLNYPDEQDLPMRAGDLLVGDARMFHATHENGSFARRTVITIWFHPYFNELLPNVQSFIHHEMHRRHANWPSGARQKIVDVTPDYTGNVPPMEVHRTPDSRLT